MLNKRNQTFETNSSSTHAICIVKEEKNIKIPEKITIDLNDYEFSWDFREYNEYESKLAYILLGIMSFRDIIPALEKTSLLLKMLKEIGIKDIAIKGMQIHTDNYGDYPYFYIPDGYVDHSSEMYELIEALLSDKDLLKRYLFESNSFIATGNDNSDYDEPSTHQYEKTHDIYWKGN